MSASKRDHRSEGGSSRGALLIGRVAVILGVSAVLGFSFNASNPLGLRWKTPPPVVASVATNEAVNPTPPLPGVANAPAPVAVSNPGPERVVLTPAPPTALSPVTPPDPSPVQLDLSGVNPAPTHWPEVKELVERGEALLVDVRAKPAYDAGHIPGALSLPEMSPPEDFTAFREKYPTNTTLVFYCSSTSCSMSQRVAGRFVREFGYSSVKYMTGGYMEWQQAKAAEQAKGGSL